MNNPQVFLEVERLIGIDEPHDRLSQNINSIQETTKKLTPLKSALQTMFPQIFIPLEVGYQILSHLITVRKIYNLATATRSHKLSSALNGTVEDAAKHAYSAIVGIAAKPITDAITPLIVNASSKYLEETGIFEDITESLNLDEEYAEYFNDFYKTSLSNYLKDEFMVSKIN